MMYKPYSCITIFQSNQIINFCVVMQKCYSTNILQLMPNRKKIALRSFFRVFLRNVILSVYFYNSIGIKINGKSTRQRRTLSC